MTYHHTIALDKDRNLNEVLQAISNLPKEQFPSVLHFERSATHSDVLFCFDKREAELVAIGFSIAWDVLDDRMPGIK